MVKEVIKSIHNDIVVYLLITLKINVEKRQDSKSKSWWISESPSQKLFLLYLCQKDVSGEMYTI